ncbi:MAG: xanthine dehydrogenase family protein subunit M [Planctomycetota bacterium]|nr:MAG: xanthine dehydrogenase family protein subunit M [Planctomycetota bacterium]
MRRFSYHVAADAVEAARLGAEGSALRKAGGTDLLDRMKEGLERPATVVGMHRALPTGLRREGEWLWIGAGTTLAELGRSAELRRLLPSLAESAGEAATPAIREAATLGGNLFQRPRCWYFRSRHYLCRKKGGAVCWAQEGRHEHHALFDNDHCAVVHPANAAPALIAAGAVLHLVGGDGRRRQLPLAEAYTPAGDDPEVEHRLAADEIVVEVAVPAAALGPRSAHVEIRHKQSFDWPLAMAAANLNGRPGLVLGAVASTPRPVPLPEPPPADEPGLREWAAAAARRAVADATPLPGNAWRLRPARAAAERALLRAAGLAVDPGRKEER